MTTVVVAGGGVAGLLAARLLLRGHDRVVLIEREASCGGLLGSLTNDDGVVFDHGAHVLSDTGVAELDDLLYGALPADLWREFNVLRAGNWFGGAMNRTSPFQDARRLPQATFERGLEELLAAPGACAEPAHLQDRLDARFGPTFARAVIGAALRKQLGVDAPALHRDTPFALPRLICADAGQSRRLKTDRRLGEVVAYTSYEEGVGTIRHRYPRSGGIGQWLDGFERDLGVCGVEVRTGTSIAGIEHAGGRIVAVQLHDQVRIDCDLLVWTLPSAFLLRAAGIPFAGSPPAIRPIGLFHLVFDRPFADANYHISCYDPEPALFRVTLYPNLRGAQEQAPFNCTVEVIGGQGTDFAALTGSVVADLSAMGITAPGARLLSSCVTVVPVGFPPTTDAFIEANRAQATLAANRLHNAVLLGRARCPPFFTSDVLIEVHRVLGEGGGGTD